MVKVERNIEDGDYVLGQTERQHVKSVEETK